MAKAEVKERMVQLAEVLSINRQLELITDRMFNLLAMRDIDILVTLKPGTKYVEFLLGRTRKYKVDPKTLIVREAVGRKYFGGLENFLNQERQYMHRLKEKIKEKGLQDYLHGVKPEVKVQQKETIDFKAKGKIYFCTWGHGMSLVEFVRVYDETQYQAKVVKLKTIVRGDQDPRGGTAVPGQPIGNTFRLNKKKILGRPALVGKDKSGKGSSQVQNWYEWDGKPKNYNTWD